MVVCLETPSPPRLPSSSASGHPSSNRSRADDCPYGWTAKAHGRSARSWRARPAARHLASPTPAPSATRVAPLTRSPDRAAGRRTTPLAGPPKRHRTARTGNRIPAWRNSGQTSGASGMSMPGLTPGNGPLALGLMSKSKISVGSHKVAQALGMSTTPLIWPCTGATPRMA